MGYFDFLRFGNIAITIIIGGIILTLVTVFMISSRTPPVTAGTLNLPGKTRQIETHLGLVTIREIGSGKGLLVVCLPGVNPALTDEWAPVGRTLSDGGYRVVIINFHSNAKTKPAVLFGDIASDDVNKIIITIMDDFKMEQIFLMGKSWGGGKAMEFIQKHPKRVSKLCLVAPANVDPEVIKGVKEAGRPVLLAWAKDDSALWFSNTETWKKALGDQMTMVTAEKGGHRILNEYGPRIMEFITGRKIIDDIKGTKGDKRQSM
jgi:dienelactone hydrolase